MTNLQIAKNDLSGHLICLVKTAGVFSAKIAGDRRRWNFIMQGIYFSRAELAAGRATALPFENATRRILRCTREAIERLVDTSRNAIVKIG